MPLPRALAVLLATATLTPGPALAATTGEHERLLRRHAPVLHLDARDRDHPTSVEALVRGGPPAPGDRRRALDLRSTAPGMPDVVYGRAVRGTDGRTWLQWWMLSADNPQDRGILRTGRHRGDWEVVQARVGPGGRPDLSTYAQHGWAEACAWRGPDVFVANGSHASYPTRGEHGRPWPDPDDEARGDGRVVRPRVAPFGPWERWPGRWGTTPAGWVPSESPSPRGPAFQDAGPHADPAGFHASARACASGAPPHPWPVYAGAALALLAVVGVLTSVLRTRRRRRA